MILSSLSISFESNLNHNEFNNKQHDKNTDHHSPLLSEPDTFTMLYMKLKSSDLPSSSR